MLDKMNRFMFNVYRKEQFDTALSIKNIKFEKEKCPWISIYFFSLMYYAK